jgi:GT2 family glycosyltransferase
MPDDFPSVPIISVVIPTFRRNQLLSRCLGALAPGRQTVASGLYEVIVSDDDGQAESLITGQFPWVQWTRGPGHGPGANRNHGARQARGAWLVFVDDDCIPSEHWLAAIHQAFAAQGDLGVVEGLTWIPDKVDNPFREGIENLNGQCYWSCNLAVRTCEFNRLGGFDEDLQVMAEDMEFAWRCKRAGIKAQFTPDAVVAHPCRDVQLGTLLRRYAFQFRWFALFHLKTAQGPSLDTSGLLVVGWRLWERPLELLRTTWHLWRDWNPKHWKSPMFRQLLRWLVLPVSLPVFIYWDLTFRKQLLRASGKPRRAE